jgi:hypothetical protein
MTDTTHYCPECERLTRELEAVRRDRDMLREQCQRDHEHALRAEAERDGWRVALHELDDRAERAEASLDTAREAYKGQLVRTEMAEAKADAMRADLEVADDHVRSLVGKRDVETLRADDNYAEYRRVMAERDECHRVADERGDRIIQLEIELERTRHIVDIALRISDSDLSVYDDVPDAHDLMNELDITVDAYRAATSEQEIEADPQCTHCGGWGQHEAYGDRPCPKCGGNTRAASSDGNCPPDCNGEACHMTPPCKQKAEAPPVFCCTGTTTPCDEHANGHTSTEQQSHEEESND